MTAQQALHPSTQGRKKKQRQGQSGEDSTHPQAALLTSSQRLADLASHASTPKDKYKQQVYSLRSAGTETGKDIPAVSLRPSYLSESFYQPSEKGTVLEPEGAGVGGVSEDNPNTSTTGLDGTSARADNTSPSIAGVNSTPIIIDMPNHEEPPPPPPPKSPPGQEVIRLADIMERLDNLSGVSGKIDSMAEDLKQLRVIRETTSHLSAEMSGMKESVTELQSTVSTLEAKEEETELNQQAIAKELIDLKEQVRILQSQQSQQAQQPVEQQPVSQSEMDFFKLKMEAALKWNNLIFEGIREPQSEREGSVRRQIQHFCRNMLGISHAEIDRAYRLGKPRTASALPRPIFVRFSRPSDREDIWRAKPRLADQNNDQFVIKEDLPLQLRSIMAALTRVMQTARNFPHKYNVFIRDFKIYVNGVPYEAKNLENLPRDLRPYHASTPGNSRVVVFFGKESRFSNHYPSTFQVDDIEFSSMEQFLAHSRARFADDQQLMDRALASADPVEAKRILNLLRDAPRQLEWEEERHDILISGLLAKFRQNSDLRKYLISSEDRQLGEASKNKTWGIGIS